MKDIRDSPLGINIDIDIAKRLLELPQGESGIHTNIDRLMRWSDTHQGYHFWESQADNKKLTIEGRRLIIAQISYQTIPFTLKGILEETI